MFFCHRLAGKFRRAVLGAFPAALLLGLLASAMSAAHAASQTITFNNPGAQNFGTTPTLTASANSGLGVTFTSSTTWVCTITSGGALTFVTAGTCSITASQPGDTTYSAATAVTQNFYVNAVVPAVPTGVVATAGNAQASVTFTAPVNSGGAAITGYTVRASPGSLTASGPSSPITVTGLSNGTNYIFTVTATNAAGAGSSSGASNSVTPNAGTGPVANTVSATVAYNSSNSAIALSITGTADSVAVAGAPSHGTATASGTRISYTPAAGYSGSDSFTYTATNANGTSAQATVNITVSAAVPAATAVSVVVAYGSSNNAILLNVAGAAASVAVVSAPTHGTATASGAGISYTPVAGYSGADSFTYTATNGSGTSAAATVSITVNPAAPVAGPVTVKVGVNSSSNPIPLNLSGGAASSVAVVSAASHGSATASGAAISYTPVAGFSGSDSFSYTATNAAGTSAAATVTVLVQTRPNPTKDAEVSGLINAQAESASRFAQAQIGNFQSHLESLHQRSRRGGFAATTTGRGRGETSAGGSGETSASTDPATGTSTTDDTRILGRTSRSAASATRQTSGSGSVYGTSGGAPFGSGLDTFVLPQKNSAGSTDALSLLPWSLSSLNLAGKHGDVLSNGLEVWTGGVVSLGRQNDSDTRFTTSGISLGADRRFGDELTVGVGAGFGHERQTIGDNGTRNVGDSYSFVVYGSYQPSEGIFFDGLIGYGTLDFDASRYVSAQDVSAAMSRRGTQWFSSISGGYDYLFGKLLLSNYSRLDVGSSRLKRATESGGGIYNLSYFEQTISTTKLSFGVRGETEVELSSGVAKPYFRVEYQHNFVTPDAARMAYADELYTVYQLAIDGVDRDTLVLGLGGDLMLKKELALGMGYRYSQGSESTRIHTLGFHLKKAF